MSNPFRKISAAIGLAALFATAGWWTQSDVAGGAPDDRAEVVWGPETITIGRDGTAAASYRTNPEELDEGDSYRPAPEPLDEGDSFKAEAQLHGSGVVTGLEFRIDNAPVIAAAGLDAPAAGWFRPDIGDEVVIGVEARGKPGTKVRVRIVREAPSRRDGLRDVIPLPDASHGDQVRFDDIILKFANPADGARRVRVSFLGEGEVPQSVVHQLPPGSYGKVRVPAAGVDAIRVDTRRLAGQPDVMKAVLTLDGPSGPTTQFLDLWTRA